VSAEAPAPSPAPIIAQEAASIHPLLWHMPQATARGLAGFLMANAPRTAPVLEEIDAFTRAEGEDMIGELEARNNCSFSVQANTARLALIATEDAKIAQLDAEKELLQRDGRNARALVPLTMLVIRIRQTAGSKRSKQQLAMLATSCRQQEAKRARLL